jgi:hypothetical protein
MSLKTVRKAVVAGIGVAAMVLATVAANPNLLGLSAQWVAVINGVLALLTILGVYHVTNEPRVVAEKK